MKFGLKIAKKKKFNQFPRRNYLVVKFAYIGIFVLTKETLQEGIDVFLNAKKIASEEVMILIKFRTIYYALLFFWK